MHSESTALLFRQDPKDLIFQISVLFLSPSKVKKINPGPLSLNTCPLAPRSELSSILLGQKCYFSPERTDVSYWTQRGNHRPLMKGWRAEEGVSDGPH